VTRDEVDLSVLRFLDRGELIAQCNISPLDQLPADRRFTLEEFQGEVERALGKNFGRIDSAVERKTAHGLRLMKVVAEGTVSELPIQWRYYLAIDPEGHRVALTYTLESKLIERFADADMMMIESLEFASPSADAAPKPGRDVANGK
jgi:YD repeat-containing protein